MLLDRAVVLSCPLCMLLHFHSTPFPVNVPLDVKTAAGTGLFLLDSTLGRIYSLNDCGHFLNGCASWVVHAQCFCCYQLVSLLLRQQAADIHVVTVLYALLMPLIT